MNVSLTPQLETMIQQRVASGRYNNASEVVREALRLLEEREKEEQAKLEHLRSLLAVGLEQRSGVSSSSSRRSTWKTLTEGRRRRTSAARNPILMSARRPAIRLTPEADLDLKSILNYTRRTWGEGQTAMYRAAISRSLASLRDHPRSGEPRDNLLPGCRWVRVEQHVIYYRQPQPDEIEVVRILHATGSHRQRCRANVVSIVAVQPRAGLSSAGGLSASGDANTTAEDSLPPQQEQRPRRQRERLPGADHPAAPVVVNLTTRGVDDDGPGVAGGVRR